MHHAAAEPAAEQRANANRQECKTHVGALLFGRGKFRDVFIVPRRLNDLAERKKAERKDGAPQRRPESHDQPGERRYHGAENDRLEGGNLSRQEIDHQGEADDDGAIGNEDLLDGNIGINIALDVARQNDVLLPEDDPIPSKDHKKKHEARVGEHSEEVPHGDGNAWRRLFYGAFRFPVKEKHGKEHNEYAERGNAEDCFDPETSVRPTGDVRTGGPADIDHGVVNGIADRADVFLGGARRGADDARFDERDAEGRENQDEADEEAERDGIANRRKPGRSDGTDEKVGGGEDEIGERQSAAKTELVCNCAAENGEEPDHAAENAGERSGLLGGKVQLSLQVEGERRKRAIVGEALEDLGDVGNPEGALEPVADFLEPLAQTHRASWCLGRDSNGDTSCTRALISVESGRRGPCVSLECPALWLGFREA